MTKQFRPVPGKYVRDFQNRIVEVKRYGTDASGEYVEVQLGGSYGAHVRLPLSCIAPLREEDRAEIERPTDMIIAMLRREEDPENLVLKIVKERAKNPNAPKYTFPED